MWKDKIHERYWWARIQDQLDELIYELSKAEEEEAALVYLLGLHLSNFSDLKFFDARERAKVIKLLTALMDFSKQHSKLLTQALQESENKKEHNARASV